MSLTSQQYANLSDHAYAGPGRAPRSRAAMPVSGSSRAVPRG